MDTTPNNTKLTLSHFENWNPKIQINYQGSFKIMHSHALFPQDLHHTLKLKKLKVIL